MIRSPLRILLIEGGTDEISLVKRHLAADSGSADRFILTEAVRISSACRVLARAEFAAIVLDLQLPQSVGLEGFHLIRAQHPKIPIVLLTGLQDESLAISALKHGAQDYLVKGTIDFCLLKRALRYAIEKKKLTLQVESLLERDAAPKLIVDDDDVVLYANPAAETLCGASIKELTGKPFAYPKARGATDALPRPSAELAQEMAVGEIEWNGATARLISFLAAPPSEDAGLWKRAAEESRRLNDIKDVLTKRLSHEMRNTLSTVKTAVFCLKDPQTGDITAKQSRLLDMISRNVNRQVHIFDKIGGLAAFDGGNLKYKFRRLDLSAIIHELARAASFKDATVPLEVDSPDPLPLVDGDADLLFEVFRNLLDNAYRYARTKVVLSATADEAGGVRVSVFNDGVSIPQGRLAGLFTPFSELDKTEGLAGFNGRLGLTMSYEIITGHKGRIWAESDETGCRFSFTLPGHAASETLQSGTIREQALLL